MAKRIVADDEFLSKVSDEFFTDFVNVPEALQGLLVDILEEYSSDISQKRIEVYRKFPELEELDERESEITLKLLDEGKGDEAHDFQLNLALEFLKRYPRFKVMVERLETPAGGFIRMILDTITGAFLGDL